MTTKDLIYLSLLVLSAVVFYAMGFYGGFDSTIKELRRREKEDRRRLRATEQAADGMVENEYEQLGTGSGSQSVPRIDTPLGLPVAKSHHASHSRQTRPGSGQSSNGNGAGGRFPIRGSFFGRN